MIDVPYIHTAPDSRFAIPLGTVEIAYLSNMMGVEVELETVVVGMVGSVGHILLLQNSHC